MQQTNLVSPTVEYNIKDGEIVIPIVKLTRSPLTNSNVLWGTVTLLGAINTAIGDVEASSLGHAAYILDSSLLDAGINQLEIKIVTDKGEQLIQKAAVTKWT